jgi:hypothetical protein
MSGTGVLAAVSNKVLRPAVLGAGAVFAQAKVNWTSVGANVKVAGTLGGGAGLQLTAVAWSVLMIVANALAGVPTWTERLLGRTAATKGEPISVKNVALTEVAAFRVTVHALVPLQPPPLQPVKTEPVAAVAVSVTAVPLT